MIQKKVRLMLAALLAVVMALCLWGFTAQAFAAESVDLAARLLTIRIRPIAAQS